MSLRLSIVIPAYNAAPYIRTCLASLPPVAETEVIVVIDGSADGTAEICREEFPQVRVFEREHAGQGAARNFGLTQAEGEYVWFVDADALLRPKALSILSNQILENKYERVYRTNMGAARAPR